MSRWTFLLAVALVGCGRQNDDPEGAKQLYAKVAGYRSWRRAPAYPGRTPSFTAHADEVEIFVNQPIADALAHPPAPASPPTAVRWPDGSIVVKEGYSGGDLALVAIMEKRAGRWYWAEYDESGEPIYSGEPKICVDCHQRRSEYSDWVYALSR